MDHAAPEAAPRDHALLGHERRVLDPQVRVLRALDRPVLGRPGLVEQVRGPLPPVPQVFDRQVREVADHVLLGEQTDQRAVLTAH